MEEGRGNIGQPFVVTADTTELSRNLDDYPEGIVLPIDKPYRWTSADVIRKLKYAAIRHFGRKNLKIGHAGTLDPLATGILIVCIGRATKLAQGLMDHDKEYVAGVCFGATTPSYDLEKEIDREFPYGHITEALLREKLAGFIGEQEQVAPLFSAKSIDGVRAYEHARRLYNKQRMGQGSGVSGDLAVQGGGIPDEGMSPDGKTVFDAAAGELIRTAHIRINEAELLGFWPAGKSVSGSEGWGLNGVGDSENIN
ncbi:MAG: hypothetical protein LUD72_00595, partial [Bacteroidales bacterium]|nr:hypothetical protein [Bacteroidales bacterium]